MFADFKILLTYIIQNTGFEFPFLTFFFHVVSSLLLIPSIYFLSLNLPARTITLNLDKQHFVKPDTTTILQCLRLGCKTECCAQTKEKKKKRATRKSCYLTQTLYQSFFPCFYVVCLIFKETESDFNKSNSSCRQKKGQHWLPYLVSFKSFKEWPYFIMLPFSQRKIRVVCGYFTFQVF